MPFYDDEPSNSPFVPEMPHFLVRAEQLAKQARIQAGEEEPEGSSFFEGIMRENWVASNMRRAHELKEHETRLEANQRGIYANDSTEEQLRLIERAENYDPYPKLRDQDYEFVDYFSTVGDDEELERKQRYIDKLIERRELAMNGGIEGIGGLIAGGMLSPEFLIPGAAQARLWNAAQAGWSTTKIAGSWMAADGFHELMNYATDDTYNVDDIYYAAMGSLMINSALGIASWKAFKYLDKDAALEIVNDAATIGRARSTADSTPLPATAQQQARAAQKLVDDTRDVVDDVTVTPLPERRSVGASQVIESEQVTYELVGKKFLRAMHLLLPEKATVAQWFLSPVLVGSLHSSWHMNKYMAHLAQHNMMYKQAKEVGWAPPKTADHWIAQYQGREIQVTQKIDQLWRQQKDLPGGLPRKEFQEEVTRALRGLSNQNKHANEAAIFLRTEFYDPILDHGKRLGLFDEDIFDPNYINRVFDKDVVLRRREDLRVILKNQFRNNNLKAYAAAKAAKAAGDPNITAADLAKLKKRTLQTDSELNAAATETLQKIIDGHSLGKGLGGADGMALKERVLDIDDAAIQDFLINDSVSLVQRYNFMASRKIAEKEMLNSMGATDLDEYIDEMGKYYDGLIDAAKTKKAKEKLQAKKTDAAAFIREQHDRWFNPGSGAANTPGGRMFTQSVNNWMKLQALAFMPAVVISSLPDIARLFMVGGKIVFGHGFNLAVHRSIKHLKEDEYVKAGALMERAMSLRMNEQMGIIDNTSTGVVTRAIDRIYSGFGKWTGIQAWNHNLKVLAISGAEHSIMQAANTLATGGKLSARQMRELATWGLDGYALQRIGEQIKKGRAKQIDGLWLSNVDSWDDAVAADMLTDAWIKASSVVINTPSKGTLPIVFDNALGRMILQFQSFLPTSHVQTLVPLLQRVDDPNQIMGAVGLIAMGAGIVQIKEMQREITSGEKSKPMDTEKLFIEAIDRSGVIAMPFQINNMAEKWGLGLRPLIDQGVSQRFIERGKVESVLGPGVGSFFKLTEAFINLAREAATDENHFKGRHVEDIWRRIPYLAHPLFTTPNPIAETLQETKRDLKKEADKE